MIAIRAFQHDHLFKLPMLCLNFELLMQTDNQDGIKTLRWIAPQEMLIRKMKYRMNRKNGLGFQISRGDGHTKWCIYNVYNRYIHTGFPKICDTKFRPLENLTNSEIFWFCESICTAHKVSLVCIRSSSHCVVQVWKVLSKWRVYLLLCSANRETRQLIPPNWFFHTNPVKLRY